MKKPYSTGSSKNKARCIDCGAVRLVYDPIADRWVCPICGKSVVSRVNVFIFRFPRSVTA